MHRNSYLIIVPNYFKNGYDNHISVFIAATAAFKPVKVICDLTIGQQHFPNTTRCKLGETCQVTLSLPKEFPIGRGELTNLF
jgi:hypothetical protein